MHNEFFEVLKKDHKEVEGILAKLKRTSCRQNGVAGTGEQ